VTQSVEERFEVSSGGKRWSLHEGWHGGQPALLLARENFTCPYLGDSS
jgi:hypothetical protein